MSSTSTATSNDPDSQPSKHYTTPAQDQLRADIATLKDKIIVLTNLKNSGFATDENKLQLGQARKKLQQKEKDLELKKKNVVKQREHRKAALKP